jgi:hypothetical protein
MFFHTKIKWTIDAENSEIFFTVRYLSLGCANKGINKMNNTTNADEFNINKYLSNPIFHKQMYEDNGGDKRSLLYVKAEEFSKTINYNLVIFEDKNPKQFWKRKTFGGLLILKNTGKHVLITLQHTASDFDNCGRAAATYFVKGKLKKDDFDQDMSEIEGIGRIILDSELFFEGKIRLIQEA